MRANACTGIVVSDPDYPYRVWRISREFAEVHEGCGLVLGNEFDADVEPPAYDFVHALLNP